MIDQKTKKTEGGVKKKYFEGYGGRKTANARVRFYPEKGGVTVNGKEYKHYFKDAENQQVAVAPFTMLKIEQESSANVTVHGGGIRAQAEAVRNGIARALALFNPEFKKKLRRSGYITRDARVVERKKYGLKKARRAPQWAKR
jgi:small subunit ribosomal protein S9